MIRKSFFGFIKPRLEYVDIAESQIAHETVSAPETATLLIDVSENAHQPLLIKPGMKVNTGQPVTLFDDKDDFSISPVTGTVIAIKKFTGNFGHEMRMVSIKTDAEDCWDPAFVSCRNAPANEDRMYCFIDTPCRYPFYFFTQSIRSIHTMVITGLDTDLSLKTNQYFIKNRLEDVLSGIRILRETSGVDNAVLAVPHWFAPDISTSGVTVKKISAVYPSAFPRQIAETISGKRLEPGITCENAGFLFITPETAANVSTLLHEGTNPFIKTFTLIDKNSRKKMVSAKIGTPVGHIFRHFNIPVNEHDRIIMGGPMTGTAIYSENHPVGIFTDGLIIQNGSSIHRVSRTTCTNCGECVRICPVKLPVHRLIRYLSAGLYEEAADNLGLYDCIECGLCNFVCVSHIPILHHIRLGKYELSKPEPEPFDGVRV